MDDLENTGSLFIFYDSFNNVLYLGRKSDNKIFCFEYNKNRNRLEYNNQIISADGGILSICSLPKKRLNDSKNEIMKYIFKRKTFHYFF